MSTTSRPDFLIESELGFALERQALYVGDDRDDRISRFQRDENRREIERLTAELEIARAQP